MANLSNVDRDVFTDEVVVQVTPDDINNGVRMSHAYCPVALAVRRHFPDYAIAVGTTGMSIALKYVGTVPTARADKLGATYRYIPVSEEYPVDPVKFIKDFDSESYDGIESYLGGFTFKILRAR